MKINLFICMTMTGFLSASPWQMSNATKEEMIEGIELFIGGAVSSVASTWVTAGLSLPILQLSETIVRALVGGISPLIFVLLMHLLHRLLTRDKGHDHDHSDEKEKIERGSSLSISGGSNLQAQGSCCPGCSVAFCNAIRRKKRKDLASQVEKEFSMQSHDEQYFNFKDASLDKESVFRPVDCAGGFCQVIDPNGDNALPFPTFQFASPGATAGAGTRGTRRGAVKVNKYKKLLKPGKSNIKNPPELDNQNIKGSNEASKVDVIQEDPTLMTGKTAAVAEEAAGVEAVNFVH